MRQRNSEKASTIFIFVEVCAVGIQTVEVSSRRRNVLLVYFCIYMKVSISELDPEQVMLANVVNVCT
jgi:hypothetical protein